METNFSPEQLSRHAFVRSDEELKACLQCGYCIPNCPTHQLTGDEYDSPRGRIYLIKEMLESERAPDSKTVAHIDRCLYCLACMSSCPSSVHYMHLVDHAREHIEEKYRRPLFERTLRWMLARTLPYPDRFRFAMRGARLAKSVAFVLPIKLRRMVELIPSKIPTPSASDKPQVFQSIGTRKMRVALLNGCAQKALNTDINNATIRVLRRHGCEVVVAQGAGCCGAVTHHMGNTKESRAAAAKNIRAWMREVNGAGLDAVVINTSGCGTMVKDYGYLFENNDLAGDAATISALARDVSELLSELELQYQVTPKMRVAYHATCSLQFGQRIRFKPKKLLKDAGFSVLEPRDSHTCCGAAGTYNLLQPEVSDQLKDRKVKNLQAEAPDAIVAGNIGCMIQIGSASRVPVVHTVELLDWVTGGPVPPALRSIAIAADIAA